MTPHAAQKHVRLQHSQPTELTEYTRVHPQKDVALQIRSGQVLEIEGRLLSVVKAFHSVGAGRQLGNVQVLIFTVLESRSLFIAILLADTNPASHPPTFAILVLTGRGPMYDLQVSCIKRVCLIYFAYFSSSFSFHHVPFRQRGHTCNLSQCSYNSVLLCTEVLDCVDGVAGCKEQEEAERAAAAVRHG